MGWGGVIPTQRLATLVDLCLCFYMNSMGWGNTNPTSCYASGSVSMPLHELDGVGLGWGGVG